MARIDPVPIEKAGWFVRCVRWAVSRRTGMEASEAWTLLAHHKGVLGAVLLYMGILDRWRRLPLRLKRLIHLRVAMRVGCPA